MKFQVEVTNKHTKARKVVGPFYASITALNSAIQYKRKGVGVIITRDSEGADHPENAGKFFLHHIVS